MFKKGDIIQVEGLEELKGMTFKVKLFSAKLKAVIINHKGSSYTIPLQHVIGGK